MVAAGSYSFGYDANGNMTSRNGSSIFYTSYNLPSVINAGAGYSSTLSYGAFRNRYKQIAVTPTGTETTIYVAGLMERVTRGASTEFRHYIAGGQGTAAIYTRVSGGASSTYYLHRDHLGSSELITDSAGLELVRPSFGAYGERRDGTDWSGPPSAADLTDIANSTRRGFTGHEHLDAVGLIHMNGRVYEPVAGRFLSVDPLIDGFASSQGPNSFAYVHNNPLTFTDPSGLSCDGPDDLDCPPQDEDWWDDVYECQGFWIAGWSPDCENQYYLGPQGDEVVDITGPGSGQNPIPLTPAEAWDGVISGDGTPQGNPSVLKLVLWPAELVLSPILDYFSDPGKNYCGPEGVIQFPNAYGDVEINVSCYRHDVCYDESGVSRAGCDEALKRDIIKTFETQEGNPIIGFIVAQNYFAVVRLFGGPAYDARQAPRMPRMAVPTGIDWSKLPLVRR